jgi:16S rRNA (cytosine1402-N4)-methyltransferase
MNERERPARRKRYGGNYPRRFEEKYKEHDPRRFSETVAKVIASGKTPAGSHVPVMVRECLAAIRPQPGMVGVDATLGYGGHALHILQAITPGGKLIGLDLDPRELPKTEARLHAAGFGPEAFTAIRSNYAGIAKALAACSLAAADFVFADLGCSSMQLDDPSRGFSFKSDGPLDMRMNPDRGIPAREFLRKTAPLALEEILREHADEPRAELLAPAIAGRDFATTTALVAALRDAMGPLPPEDTELSVRRVFQAIRIAVNDEFGGLDAFLRVLPGCLKPGGRVAVLTFHSGEDRRVKKAFQDGCRRGIFSATSDGVTTAGPDERRANPRSIPAKLRWAVRGTAD